MKVLVIQDYLRCGGTEIQSIALTEGFLQNGWDSSLLTFRPGGALADLALQKDIPWRPLLPKIDLKLNWYAPNLVQHIETAAPDTVLLMGREANSKAHLLRKHFPRLSIVGTFRTGRPVPSRYRQSLSACTHVVTNSEWAATKVSNLGGVGKEQISVIYNGVAHTFNYEARDDIRTEYRTKHHLSDTVVFLMVASFRKGKNHHELLHVFDNFPGKWELWLAGYGPAQKSFCKALNNCRFRTQVKILGQISELEPLYFTSDIAILPSEEESLPNFLIESQMSGLPVVAYDCAGVCETFNNHKTGLLIQPGNTEEFRHQLINLMNNAGLREQMSKDACVWAKDRFDPQKRLLDWIHLIESLIN